VAIQVKCCRVKNEDDDKEGGSLRGLDKTIEDKKSSKQASNSYLSAYYRYSFHLLNWVPVLNNSAKAVEKSNLKNSLVLSVTGNLVLLLT
jgi:hypothetical protein